MAKCRDMQFKDVRGGWFFLTDSAGHTVRGVIRRARMRTRRELEITTWSLIKRDVSGRDSFVESGSTIHIPVNEWCLTQAYGHICLSKVGAPGEILRLYPSSIKAPWQTHPADFFGITNLPVLESVNY